MRTDRRVTMLAIGILCGLALVSAPAARAMDEAEIERQRLRLQKEFDAMAERIADKYIDEQDTNLRPDVTAIVGGLFEAGLIGGGPDPVLAVRYYETAAREGSIEAECALATVYNVGAETDSGTVKRDTARAIEHFETAVAGGSVRAMLELGFIYAEGKNVDPDSKRALSYFVEAAKRGDETALQRLEPVMRKAREWEEAKPDRKGKAGFPTGKETMIQKPLMDEAVDRAMNMEKLASSVYVELSRRIGAEMKKSLR